MAKISRPRKGSLQYYPRKRASKFLPSVNWKTISSKEQGILGFIVYKVGMASASVKDSTEHSMTKGKKIIVPVTILEAPNMKVYSIRFYRKSLVVKDIVVSMDKDLRRVLKVSKNLKDFDKEIPQIYDDIKLIAYSLPKQAGLKKTPDMTELAISSKNKLEFAKSLIGKEIALKDFIKPDFLLLDARGLTKGHGTQGAVKRFGITLKAHKSEKGRRRPGSLGPWHPARVTFRTPMAGQLGMFTRIQNNLKLINFGEISQKNINPSSGFTSYGKINSNYIIIKGSVQGPPKRQVLITPAFRPTKSQLKKKYEFIHLEK